MRRSTILGFVLSGLAILTVVDSAGAQFMGRWNRGWGSWYGGGPYYGSSYNYGTPYYGSSYSYGTPYYGSSYSYGAPSYYNRYPGYSNWSGTGYSTAPYSTTYSSAPLDMSTSMAQGYGPYTSQSFYSGPTSYEDRVRMRVIVPTPDTRPWLEGRLMDQTGMERLFYSPPLQPGEYIYTMRASWTDNGREVTREKQLTVRPGQEQTVFFGPADTGDKGDKGSTRDIGAGMRGREGISNGSPGTEGTGGFRTGTQGTGDTGGFRSGSSGTGIGGIGNTTPGGSTGTGGAGTSGNTTPGSTGTGGAGTSGTGTGGTGTGSSGTGGTGGSGR